MKEACEKYGKNYEICLTQKYDRQPKLQNLNSTPIPTKVGEQIQILILEKNYFVIYCCYYIVVNITREHIRQSNAFADVETRLERVNNITREYIRESNQPRFSKKQSKDAVQSRVE